MTQTSFASLARARVKSSRIDRRIALNNAAKRATRRLYAAQKAIEEALRTCTASVAEMPVEMWDEALNQYEAALAPYLPVAESLPASIKETSA